MTLNIIVCVKQVIDPDTPLSKFHIDKSTQRVVPPDTVLPVINGFDECAIEAATQIKEAQDANVTVLSVGKDLNRNVMKKSMAMGADDLVLVDDPAADDLDAFATVTVLAAAINRIGAFDLLLFGRQASDWDNGHVPLGVAEALDLPCITVAQKIDVNSDTLKVRRSLTDMYQVVETRLPAVVTVSNEFGEPRNPTIHGIMAAKRKVELVWSLADLGLSADDLNPKIQVLELLQPVRETNVEMITGDEPGRTLARRMRELELI